MIPEKIKILIVEDNPPDAFLLLEAFQEFGNGDFELAQANNLELALKRVRAENFDAVLLDLSLPIFLGLEPLERVHRIRPKLPIFVLSGYNDSELASEAKRRGAQNYIVKNHLDGDALIKMVRSSVEISRKPFPSKTLEKPS
jgi:CheY-like chemotaxis protein